MSESVDGLGPRSPRPRSTRHDPPGDAWPSAPQVRVAQAIVAWYLRHYYASSRDVGVLSMFCDQARVGHFAVRADDVRRGSPAALFRLLISTAMFQRRQDVQIMRILRSISAADAEELTSVDALLRLVEANGCAHAASTEELRLACDLHKNGRGEGACGREPGRECHLKRHTVLLKRYGHFGKVPTSAAVALREAGVADLVQLRASVYSCVAAPRDRALALEEALSRSWRVNQKIASMFLSMVCNPDMSAGAPWADGIDWTHFVVIDSNVDLFLRRVGYEGLWTYEARRGCIQHLARRIDLTKMDDRLHRYNPRIVQQAVYLFMSATNRRAAVEDCMHRGPVACAACPPVLRAICPTRTVDGA